MKERRSLARNSAKEAQAEAKCIRIKTERAQAKTDFGVFGASGVAMPTGHGVLFLLDGMALCGAFATAGRRFRENGGQGTVEAAFLLPVLCVMVLLLVQPGILLYDRMVMAGAAADACRLLATKTDLQGSADEQCEAYVRHRLGAVPQQDCFHVHDPECTWDIRFDGDEATQSVQVSISTEVRPLPLIGTAGELLGIVNGRGNFEVEVSVAQQTQPAWVDSSSAGREPALWIGAWLDEA